jgi:aminopeptidase N
MTLQALRAKAGDASFFALLREWYARNRDGNATTADFVALAEELTGQQLDSFDAWLYKPGKPTSWVARRRPARAPRRSATIPRSSVAERLAARAAGTAFACSLSPLRSASR